MLHCISDSYSIHLSLFWLRNWCDWCPVLPVQFYTIGGKWRGWEGEGGRGWEDWGFYLNADKWEEQHFIIKKRRHFTIFSYSLTLPVCEGKKFSKTVLWNQQLMSKTLRFTLKLHMAKQWLRCFVILGYWSIKAYVCTTFSVTSGI